MTTTPLPDLTIRPMTDDEYPAMRQVSVAAFDEPEIGILLDALRESWAWIDGLSFVAEHKGEIVGQVLFTRSILDAPDRLVDVLTLSPIGVRPDLQGRAVGHHLITETMPILAGRPEPLVFLEGNPRYYERFGFLPAVDHGFRRPSLRTPAPAFQVRTPSGQAIDPGLNGTLVYPDAFWRTDSVGLR